MSKTILITGSTDGIGLLTAKMLAAPGHHMLLHGRSPEKLDVAAAEIGGTPERYVADLSSLADVAKLADEVRARHDCLDVLINNAGVYKTSDPILPGDQDVRFIVNTVAPYILARALLPEIPKNGRIINLSSAAQAAVSIDALKGQVRLDDMSAYAQSKLAITIWSRELAKELPEGPVVIAVNPGSLLASKMVKEGFGVAGNDLRIGADILCRLALDNAFASASGAYWDNDSGRFAEPHISATQERHVRDVMNALNEFAELATKKKRTQGK